MVFQNNVLAGAGNTSAGAGYTIDQSIRFNQADSPYMQKTYSGNGSRTTWSLSFWTKLGKVPPYNTTRAEWFQAYNTTSGAQEDIRIDSSNQDLRWFTHNDGGSGTLADLKTTQYLRDHSAWYHILCVADRTNATSSERQRIYINGQRVTDFATETYPSQNAEGHIGKSADVHYIGSRAGNVNTRLDGYMAEIVYIDGTALYPSSFGETNSSGIWVPIDVSGLTFGTNGFHIDGRDSADLGDDESGNGNDYSTSGLASNDQVSDSPTNNFCVMNPNNNSGSGTLSQGNLRYAGASTGNNVAGTIGMSSDKWYWELYIEDDNQVFPGVQDSNVLANGYTEKAVGVETGDNGDIHEDDANSGLDSVDPNTGDIVGIAFDATNKKIWWSLNGVWYRADQSTTAVINVSEVEAGNQGYDLSSRTPDFFMPFIGNYTHGTAIINFGQEGTFAGNTTAGGNSDGNGIGNFKYSVPSGYLALCTKNLGS